MTAESVSSWTTRPQTGKTIPQYSTHTNNNHTPNGSPARVSTDTERHQRNGTDITTRQQSFEKQQGKPVDSQSPTRNRTENKLTTIRATKIRAIRTHHLTVTPAGCAPTVHNRKNTRSLQTPNYAQRVSPTNNDNRLLLSHSRSTVDKPLSNTTKFPTITHT